MHCGISMVPKWIILLSLLACNDCVQIVSVHWWNVTIVLMDSPDTLFNQRIKCAMVLLIWIFIHCASKSMWITRISIETVDYQFLRLCQMLSELNQRSKHSFYYANEWHNTPLVFLAIVSRLLLQLFSTISPARYVE